MKLQVFNYNQKQVRTVQINGETWFVLKDVCVVLGITDHKVVARRLEEDEVCQVPLTDSLGRTQETTVISESGLYNVILRSDKPEAKPFRKFVTSEVLPSIRKTGGYQTKAMTTAQMFALQAQVNLEQEQRLKALEEKTQATQETVQEAFSALSYPTVSRDHWQDETRQKIRRVCFENGLNYQQFTAQTYDELEAEARVKLETRVNNQRKRMKEGGAKYAERQAVNKLTVISADPKLRAIFSAIIQRHSAQFLTERLSNM